VTERRNAFERFAERHNTSVSFLAGLVTVMTVALTAGAFVLTSFFGIRLGADHAASSSAPGASANQGPASVSDGPIADSVTRTTLRTLRPFDGNFLGEDYAVLDTVGGDCFYASLLSSDFMSMRCFTDEEERSLILDPCYPNEDHSQVACVWSYFPKQAYLLDPVSIDEGTLGGDASDDLGLAFLEVVTATKDRYGCMAIAAFAGEQEGLPRRYSCVGIDDRELQGSAFGAADREHEPWTIMFSVADEAPLRPVTIVQAWK
jgi:hypothetical protein